MSVAKQITRKAIALVPMLLLAAVYIPAGWVFVLTERAIEALDEWTRR